MVSSLLTTGKTAVLLNGVPSPWIQCRRGLQQGDPLSPYLFLIVANLLHCLVVRQGAGLMHPLVDDLRCPVIQYADDTLILIRAEEDQVRRLKQVLDSFAAATGLHINYRKSTFVPLHVDGDRASTWRPCLATLWRPSFKPTWGLGLPLSTAKLSAVSWTPWWSKQSARSLDGARAFSPRAAGSRSLKSS